MPVCYIQHHQRDIHLIVCLHYIRVSLQPFIELSHPTAPQKKILLEKLNFSSGPNIPCIFCVYVITHIRCRHRSILNGMTLPESCLFSNVPYLLIFITRLPVLWCSTLFLYSETIEAGIYQTGITSIPSSITLRRISYISIPIELRSLYIPSRETKYSLPSKKKIAL